MTIVFSDSKTTFMQAVIKLIYNIYLYKHFNFKQTTVLKL